MERFLNDMKKIILFVLLFTLPLSCKKQDNGKTIPQINPTETATEAQNSPIYSIDLKKAINSAIKQEIPFSELFSQIEYVPLETNDSSLLNSKSRFFSMEQALTNEIIIANMKMFNRKDGHYIQDILSRGQGPQEYGYVFSVVADDEQKEIYIYDNSNLKMHVVGYDNTYKKFYGIGDDAALLSLGEGNIVITNQKSLNTRRDAFYILNVNSGKILYKRISPALNGIQKLSDCPRIEQTDAYTAICGHIGFKHWIYQNKLHYYDALTDSVYTMDTTNNQMEAIGYIDTEPLRYSPDDPQKYRWFLNAIYEGQEILWINLSDLDFINKKFDQYHIFYNKKTSKVKSLKLEGDGIGFKNDLDQGITFIPRKSYSDYMYGFISADKIKDYIAKKGEAYFTTETGKKFLEMGKSLNYDDNEVVAILKWK